MKNSSLFQILVVTASTLCALPALATQTLQYNCRASTYNKQAKTGFVYDFEAIATQGTEGAPFIRAGAKLSVAKFYGPLDSDSVIFEPIVKNELLRFDGSGASWLAYSLNSSQYGLSLNFYPDSSIDPVNSHDLGYLLVFHTLSPGNTLVSEGRASCTINEI